MAKERITSKLERSDKAKSKSAVTKSYKAAQRELQSFLERLKGFRVLDPACGSGNFLYTALQALKDLEHRVILEAEAIGVPRQFPGVGPEAVKGIEINPYAAELSRVTVWIGEIQWMLRHGYSLSKNPILKPLETIEERDAVANPDGTEPEWPAVDVIVGNPPFLGGSKLLRELGNDYTEGLRALYKGRVPGGADLVTYWYEKSRAQVEAKKATYVGLVATQAIRKGNNRQLLGRIKDTGDIFMAWSDEPWINEGAAVRVSLIGFGKKNHGRKVILNGDQVQEIFSDLSGSANGGVDLTLAQPLSENGNISFEGVQKNGPFEISGEQAREWIGAPC